jgi:uncharacterized OsmC-like protein
VTSSYAATVRIAAEGSGPGSLPTAVVVQHHRVPRVEWGVETATGGHMLHLALAQCVFNNVTRLARDRGIRLAGADVTADGGFDSEGTASTGIACEIEVSGDASEANLEDLAREAFAGSTVVAVLRRAGRVELASVKVLTVGAGPSDG